VSFFRRIKHVQTKILAGFIGLALITAALGGFTVAKMGNLHEDASAFYTENVRSLNALSDARLALHQIAISILQLAVNPGAEAQARNQQALIDAQKALTAAVDRYKATDLSTVQAQMTKLDQQLPQLNAIITNTLLPALQAKDMATFLGQGASQAIPLFNAVDDTLETLVADENQHSAETFAGSVDNYNAARLWVIVFVLIAMAIAVALGIVISRAIARPLRHTVSALNKIADGDLTAHVTNDRADETGRLAEALNRMVGRMAATVSSIAGSATQLSSASEELTAVSTELSATAVRASEQATSVSAASEEVSANVHTVASGTEEMGASIREIAGNATQAASVASAAAAVAADTDATVHKLGESSAEIGQVVGTITSIAEQTNLLALNATIEAARAGEAGKGFAVVANEVKELAAETSKATGDIRGRIAAIQSDANAVASAIAQITQVIGEITDFQGTIASAVEEQTVTTNEIARNVSEAAGGSSDIAANISTVAEASNQTSAGAQNILTAAADLAHQADELHGLVTQFRL
jgi:methyl-accepting chemotaxis protein